MIYSKEDMEDELEELEECIEYQEGIIKSLIDNVYTLENELNQAKNYISNLKGELSVLYNSIE